MKTVVHDVSNSGELAVNFIPESESVIRSFHMGRILLCIPKQKRPSGDRNRDVKLPLRGAGIDYKLFMRFRGTFECFTVVTLR